MLVWLELGKSVFFGETGQGMAEYGLIIALVAIACIGAISGSGGVVQSLIATTSTVVGALGLS